MSLRSTIRQIQASDSDAAAIAADRQSFIRQWSEDLDALYARIQDGLAEFVKDQLLLFKPLSFNISEETLGDYIAPGLRIKAASREIYASPVARITSGGAGRVDLFRTDRPSESDRILIVRRIQEDGSATWLIEDKKTEASNIPLIQVVPQFMRPPRSYTAIYDVSLEKALDYLLRL